MIAIVRHVRTWFLGLSGTASFREVCHYGAALTEVMRRPWAGERRHTGGSRKSVFTALAWRTSSSARRLEAAETTPAARVITKENCLDELTRLRRAETKLRARKARGDEADGREFFIINLASGEKASQTKPRVGSNSVNKTS